MHGYLAPHPELFYEATGEVVETVGDICLIAHTHNRIYKAVEVNGARDFSPDNIKSFPRFTLP